MNIANVKLGQVLTFGIPKKVFSKSFTKFEWVSVPLLRLNVVPYVKRVKIQCSLHSCSPPWLNIAPLIEPTRSFLNRQNPWMEPKYFSQPYECSIVIFKWFLIRRSVCKRFLHYLTDLAHLTIGFSLQYLHEWGFLLHKYCNWMVWFPHEQLLYVSSRLILLKCYNRNYCNWTVWFLHVQLLSVFKLNFAEVL